MVVRRFQSTLFKGILLTIIFQQMPVQASESKNFVELVKSSGGMAPVLELSDVNAKDIVLDDFSDKVTLIHFWATWCVPCLNELPELQSISKKYRNKGLHVIAIAVDSHDSVIKFIKKEKTELDIIVDQYGSAVRDYKVNALPASYLVGKKGEIRYLATGQVNWLSEDAGQLIERLIAAR